MESVIRWIDDQTLELGGIRFHLDLSRERPVASSRLVLMKDRQLVESYEKLFHSARLKRVVELGIWGGGSTIFLERLLKPEKLLAIDRTEERVAILDQHIERLELESVISCRYGLSQEQTTRLAKTIDEEFDSGAIDLVVDDASHLLEPTRASFNCLFPRLRPGGIYIVEDWAWAHWPGHFQEGEWAKREPLTDLIFQAVMVVASFRQIVSSVRVEPGLVAIERGPAAFEPNGFEVSKFCRTRGKVLAWT
jgi:predicted O-methyltransferase YrrM